MPWAIRLHPPRWQCARSISFVCALWELFAVSWPLIPLLLIGFGLVVLFGAFRGPRALALRAGFVLVLIRYPLEPDGTRNSKYDGSDE